MIEAMWSVTFITPEGSAGAGIVVFETGRIFGGDSFYYYLGNYSIEAGTARGSIDVIHYSGPPANVFGPVEKITLQFSGKIEGNSIRAEAFDPSKPQNRLRMEFTRLANLP
jgi:hypothetical protein